MTPQSQKKSVLRGVQIYRFLSPFKLRELFTTWALRRREGTPGVTILGQRNVYVFPSGPGIGYALCLPLMLSISTNYLISLGYMLTFLLTGLGLVTIIHTYRNILGIKVRRGRCEPVFAGELARFDFLVNNERNETRYELKFQLPDKTHSTCLDTPPNATTAATIGVPTVKRGWLKLPPLIVETHWPLGLIRAWSYCELNMSCLIYPRPAEKTPPLPYTGIYSNDGMQGLHGMDDFAGLRDHLPGESPRHVAWKTVARRDSQSPLLSKHFTGNASQQILLDWNALAETDIEKKISIITRWVLDAHAEGLTWELRIPGTALPPDSGDTHLHNCLKALAAL